MRERDVELLISCQNANITDINGNFNYSKIILKSTYTFLNSINLILQIKQFKVFVAEI